MSDPLIADPPFIPREKRDSETKTGFGSYAKKFAVAAAITKAATLAGGIAGSKFGGAGGAQLGATVAGIGTGTYEAYKHWEPIKGTQERLKALLPEVEAELSLENLKQEAALQQEIQDGLKERQRLFTEMVGGKREHTAIQQRGSSAADALAHEAHRGKDSAGRG